MDGSPLYIHLFPGQPKWITYDTYCIYLHQEYIVFYTIQSERVRITSLLNMEVQLHQVNLKFIQEVKIDKNKLK